MRINRNMPRIQGDITEETAYILYRFQKVATFSRRMNDACEEEYVFKVFWDVWDNMERDEDWIEGLDMNLRLDEYVRPFVPCFLTQHIPPKDRQDIPWLLAGLGLEYYDICDYACANYRYSCDEFLMVRVEEYDEFMERITPILENSNGRSFTSIMIEFMNKYKPGISTFVYPRPFPEYYKGPWEFLKYDVDSYLQSFIDKDDNEDEDY